MCCVGKEEPVPIQSTNQLNIYEKGLFHNNLRIFRFVHIQIHKKKTWKEVIWHQLWILMISGESHICCVSEATKSGSLLLVLIFLGYALCVCVVNMNVKDVERNPLQTTRGWKVIMLLSKEWVSAGSGGRGRLDINNNEFSIREHLDDCVFAFGLGIDKLVPSSQYFSE